jgi:PAS domain S-box-containing protein
VPPASGDAAGQPELHALKQRLSRTTRMYQTLLACVQLGQTNPSREVLFSETCRILVEVGGFTLARIAFVDRVGGVLVPVAQAGNPLDYVHPVRIYHGTEPKQRGPANEVLASNTHFVFNDVQQSGRCPIWLQAMSRAKLQSGIALPIRLDAEIIAILLVYESEVGSFPSETVALLDTLAAGLSQFVTNAMQEERRRQAESALHEHDMLLQSVINSSPDLITIRDAEHRYLFANQAAAQALHQTPEQLVGKRGQDVMLGPESPPGRADGGSMLAADREVMATGQRQLLAAQTLVIRGESRVYDILKVPMRDRGGRIWGVLDIAQDITARRETEAALRSSQRHLQFLIQYAPASLAMFDRNLRLLYMSQRWLQDYLPIGGRPVGRTLSELFPGLSGHWRQVHERLLAGEVLSSEADAFVRSDGKTRWVRWEARPWYQDDGSAGGIVIFSEDITERRDAERSRRLLSAALSVAANAVVISDPRGVIEWMNPAFIKLSGYSEAEALGKTFRELVHSGVHDSAFYSKMWSTIQSGQPWQGEITNRRKDGSLCCELMSITPLRDADGHISHYIAIKQDLSEQKRLESLVLRTQRLESVGRLAGGLAHDLNNLLTPMLMAPPMLRLFVRDPVALESLDSIEACAQRSANIIRQLLTFSRGQPVEKAPVQLRLLLREMGRLVQEAFPKNITLQQHIPHDLPTVQGDATQLQQVLMNLCVNARDAMPDGGTLALSLQVVTVDDELAKVHGVEPGAFLALEVADTGIGIPEQNLEKIFDPFFTTKDLEEGTGLGLSTTLGIVQGHHGFIEVDSAVGRGARFRVYLPVHEPWPVLSTPAILQSLPRGKEELILVVDDEALARRVICRILERHGYRTLEASEGEEALRICRAQRASLRVVITDLMMPHRDGIEFLRDLEKEPKTEPLIQVIVITGYLANPAALQNVYRTKYATLTKPFSADSLLHAVARSIGLYEEN